MSQHEISRRYAKALFATAKEKQNQAAVLNELLAIEK